MVGEQAVDAFRAEKVDVVLQLDDSFQGVGGPRLGNIMNMSGRERVQESGDEVVVEFLKKRWIRHKHESDLTIESKQRANTL